MVAYFRLVDNADKAEGFLTENTIAFIIQGAKHVHLPEQEIIARSGEMIFLKRGTYFMSAYMTDECPFQALVLCVDDSLLKSFLTDSTSIDTVMQADAGLPLVLSCPDTVLHARDTILRYMQQPNQHTSQLLELKLREVLLLLLSGRHSGQVLAFLKHLFHHDANHLALTIKSNLLKPFTLEEYAKMCGHSLSAFKREFARQFNAPPKKWINDEKLKHADFLLQNTHKNVNEVADECGFEHVSYFIKTYKARYGTTPKNASRTKSVIF